MLSLLKKEIEAKKRNIEESNVLQGEKKYFKRGDLSAKQEEAYWERCGGSRRTGDGGPGGTSGSGNSSSPTKKPNAADDDDAPELPRAEVVRRLREREEPIMLYGELDNDAFRRLRRLEILEPEVNRGQRNDFQEALERVDQAYLNEILKTEGGEGSRNVALSGETITMESVIEMARDLNNITTNTNELRSKVILKFVQLMLQMWGSKHNARPEGEKMSVRGKMDSATYTQTQAYLKPLVKCLKKRSLPDDIMECLIEIVQHCLDRDYVKANDAYLQMAIGNAPWPIGVTMVGIHARTGREKIFSKHVAHVLNDETQRKYIQGLKRLMTKCQQYFAADPSKCVEYKALSQ